MDQLVDAEAREALVEQDPRRGRRRCARSRWSWTTPRRRPTTRVRSAARTDVPDPRAAVLGRARGRGRPRRGLPPPRPPRAVQAPLGRARREGRGLAGARRGRRRRGGLPAAARAHVARAGLPAPARASSATSRCNADGNELVVFDPEDHGARDRAARLPAPAASTTASAWPTSSAPLDWASATSSRSRASPPATRSPS